MSSTIVHSQPTREEIAKALHEWHGAARLAKTSPKAELYACAVVLALELLEQQTSCADLVSTFYFPDVTLMQLIFELCAGGEIALQPRVVMGAACAARFRQLVGATIR